MSWVKLPFHIVWPIPYSSPYPPAWAAFFHPDESMPCERSAPAKAIARLRLGCIRAIVGWQRGMLSAFAVPACPDVLLGSGMWLGGWGQRPKRQAGDMYSLKRTAGFHLPYCPRVRNASGLGGHPEQMWG
jgi:hypothetical protein